MSRPGFGVWRQGFGDRGQETSPGSPLGGGQDPVDCLQVRLKILFQDDADEADDLLDGLENYLVIAFGLGGLGGLHGHFQGLTEPEEAALAQGILKLVLGPFDFGLQMRLVAVQGGSAEAVLLAEGGQGR